MRGHSQHQKQTRVGGEGAVLNDGGRKLSLGTRTLSEKIQKGVLSQKRPYGSYSGSWTPPFEISWQI